MIDTLRRNGIALLPPALTAGQCEECVEYFACRPAYNAHVPAQSDGIERPLDGYPYRFASYRLPTVLGAPHLLEWAASPAIVGLAASYLDCTPVLYSLHAFWTYPGGDGGIASFHRDTADGRALAAFVYLTDVPDDDDGPHIYRAGTHVSIGPLDCEVRIKGPAGTAFIEDTMGLHRGDTPQHRRRLVAWARYGTSVNQAYRQDQTEPVPAASVASRISDAPAHRELTRLILAW